MSPLHRELELQQKCTDRCMRELAGHFTRSTAIALAEAMESMRRETELCCKILDESFERLRRIKS